MHQDGTQSVNLFLIGMFGVRWDQPERRVVDFEFAQNLKVCRQLDSIIAETEIVGSSVSNGGGDCSCGPKLSFIVQEEHPPYI